MDKNLTVQAKYIKSNPEICFTVGKQFGKIVQHPQGAVCHSDSDSVVCFGRARIIEDIEERKAILNEFNHILQPHANDLKTEDIRNCLAVEIKISKVTAREERNNKCIYRMYDFRIKISKSD
jgi:nitroimidazol reductase NimA-like FMN-containing flavoprotein (pyridoxamine 5'-phosphate oxidase superfamily)